MCFTDNSPLRFMLREPGRPASLSFQKSATTFLPTAGGCGLKQTEEKT
jgi:hypothetical protein